MRNFVSKLFMISLFRGIVSFYLIRVITLIFPIIVIPYLARSLNQQCFGVLLYALSIGTALSLLIDYGYVLSGPRDVSRCRSEPLRLNQIASEIMASKIVLIVVSFLIALFS